MEKSLNISWMPGLVEKNSFSSYLSGKCTPVAFKDGCDSLEWVSLNFFPASFVLPKILHFSYNCEHWPDYYLYYCLLFNPISFMALTIICRYLLLGVFMDWNCVKASTLHTAEKKEVNIKKRHCSKWTWSKQKLPSEKKAKLILATLNPLPEWLYWDLSDFKALTLSSMTRKTSFTLLLKHTFTV